MDELDQLWVPEVKDWRLNERHYGDLIGKTKPEAQEAFGAENVALWASSYDIPPHPMSTTGRYYPKDDRRCTSLPRIFVQEYCTNQTVVSNYKRTITCEGRTAVVTGKRKKCATGIARRDQPQALR